MLLPFYKRFSWIGILILTAFESSCSTPFLSAGGVYVSQNDNNYIDTLTLWVDGANNSSSESKNAVKFNQNIYDRKSGILMQTNQGLWRITGSKISFKNIFLLPATNASQVLSQTEPGLSLVKESSATLDKDKIVFSSNLYYQKVK